ncbi:MAG: hypothetical protein IJL41_03495 [Clostridia bacterium]|nr:hypothetical protein [Clostridia bacterium]
MNRTRKHGGVFLHVALIIVVLTVFSSVFAAGFLAKYRTAETNAYNARVAAFDVDAQRSGSNDISYVLTEGVFVPGSETNDYVLTVANNSETAVRYSVEFVFGEGVSEYVKVYHVTEGAEPALIAPVDGRIVLEGSALVAGTSSVTETFAFAVDAAKVPLSVYSAFTADTSNPLASAEAVEIDFDALVTFVQID